MELEITVKRTLRVWWGITWRNMLMIIPTLVIGVPVGIIVGLILHILGFGQLAVRISGYVIGGLIGSLGSFVVIRIVLGRKFGDFRLVLVANSPAMESSAEETAGQIAEQ